MYKKLQRFIRENDKKPSKEDELLTGCMCPACQCCWRGKKRRSPGPLPIYYYEYMNTKIYYLVITLIMIITSAAWAQGHGTGDEIEFLYGFLEGPYHLIGRLPDSHKTYTGKLVLRRRGEHLDVIRRIDGKEIRGVGTIETATADKIKILRIRFTDENARYEASYLIGSDLDNYGRLSGYLYLQEGGTKMPGLEALFIDHHALEQQVLPRTTK